VAVHLLPSIIDDFRIPIYLKLILFHSNIRTVEVSSSVPVACSYFVFLDRAFFNNEDKNKPTKCTN